MDDGRAPPQRRPRRAGRRSRLAAHAEHVAVPDPRRSTPFEVLGEEGLSLIEYNADTILEEVGIEFRGDPEALRLFADAGADVDGERVRFPRGMCRQIVQATAPRDVHAVRAQPGAQRRDRRPEHGLRPELRLAVRARPRQRPPLRHDRGLPQLREADLHDARTCTTRAGRSASRSTCRSTSATSTWSMRTSATPTSRSWARSPPRSGRATRSRWPGSRSAPTSSSDHTVILSLINANSPLVWDATMLGAARAYAEANQATLMTPFILAGAMAPVTVAGVCAQTLAEALAGMTFVQLVRPGAPVVLGSFASLDVDAVRRADVRHAGAGAGPVRDGRAGAPARRPVPLRRQPVRLEDRRRPGRLRVGRHAPADDPRRGQLRAPRGRLARGRAHDRLREVHPRRRPVRHGWQSFVEGRRPVRERPGARRDPDERARRALPRQRRTRWPTSRRPSTAPRSPTTTASSSGSRTARSMPPSGRTRSGSGCSPSTRRRRSTRASTRRCSSSSRTRKASIPDSRRLGAVLVPPSHPALTPRPAAALAGVLRGRRHFELIPLKSASSRPAFLPRRRDASR